jgi:hypothetical protein
VWAHRLENAVAALERRRGLHSNDCVEKPRFSVRSQLARPLTRGEKFCLGGFGLRKRLPAGELRRLARDAFNANQGMRMNKAGFRRAVDSGGFSTQSNLS